MNDTKELIAMAKSVFAAGDEAKIRFFCEQSQEYKQVAALVCMDVDLLFDIASDPGKTAEELRAQIRLLKKGKDEAIADRALRERRYYAGLAIFSAIAGSASQDTQTKE